MKKTTAAAFTAICLLMCVLPFACMSFAPTTEALENKRTAEFPVLRTEDGFNTRYMTELGEYFEDHFAFKKAFVAADAKLLSLFGTSSVSGVIKGTDGWLYYTSSGDDYSAVNTLTERGAFNAAHNAAVLQRFARQHGADFLLTVAPNKNSLYPDNMPYYYTKSGKTSNIGLVVPYLEAEGVNYADLFGAFGNEDEILYLKRDSHWNAKGALLAYNALLDKAGIPHDDFSSLGYTEEEKEYGDLGKMLYSSYAAPEKNYTYDNEQLFSYVTDTKSVEDPLIVTENAEKDGTLLMFRDSFGNTLLPLMANEFGSACFSKAQPYPAEKLTAQHAPELILAEKVERNIADFALAPPVMTGPAADVKAEKDIPDGCTFTFEDYPNSVDYYRLYGDVLCSEDYDGVYIGIGDDCYEAFTVTDDAGDSGYLLYILKDKVPAGETTAKVLIRENGMISCIGTEIINTEG